MRIKSTFVLLLAIIATIAVPATAQEEPLPAIQPKHFFEPLTPEVFLAVDPIHATVRPTLADAVRANDYAAFDALYRDSLQRGISLGAYETLHEIWTYSINDPIGAFYGPDLYERLSRAYPGFARYIDDYRIVDSNGNVFYPTSETRAFLLDRAIEGARGVKVQVAQTREQPRQERTRATERSAAPSTAERAQAKPTTHVAKHSGAPASSPAGAVASRHRSAVKKVTVRDTATSAGEDAGAPLVTTTHHATPVTTPVVEAPVVVQAEPVAQQPLAPIKPADNPGSRGILLLVIGLIGIGLLAMMLRAPREVPPSIMAPPDKVEPLRKPAATPPPAQTTEASPSAKNRANGSHG